MLDRLLEGHREDLLGPAAGPMGAEARSPRGLSKPKSLKTWPKNIKNIKVQENTNKVGGVKVEQTLRGRCFSPHRVKIVQIVKIA